MRPAHSSHLTAMIRTQWVTSAPPMKTARAHAVTQDRAPRSGSAPMPSEVKTSLHASSISSARVAAVRSTSAARIRSGVPMRRKSTKAASSTPSVNLPAATTSSASIVRNATRPATTSWKQTPSSALSTTSSALRVRSNSPKKRSWSCSPLRLTSPQSLRALTRLLPHRTNYCGLSVHS